MAAFASNMHSMLIYIGGYCWVAGCHRTIHRKLLGSDGKNSALDRIVIHSMSNYTMITLIEVHVFLRTLNGNSLWCTVTEKWLFPVLWHSQRYPQPCLQSVTLYLLEDLGGILHIILVYLLPCLPLCRLQLLLFNILSSNTCSLTWIPGQYLIRTFTLKVTQLLPQHNNLNIPGTQSFLPCMASKARLKWPLLQRPQLLLFNILSSNTCSLTWIPGQYLIHTFILKVTQLLPQHNNLNIPGTQSFLPCMASKARLKWPLLQRPQLLLFNILSSNTCSLTWIPGQYLIHTFILKVTQLLPQHNNLNIPGTQSFLPCMASKARLKWPLLQQPQLHQPHTSHSSSIKVIQCTPHYMVINPSSILCLLLCNTLSCPSILRIQSLVPAALNLLLQRHSQSMYLVHDCLNRQVHSEVALLLTRINSITVFGYKPNKAMWLHENVIVNKSFFCYLSEWKE